LAASTGDFYNGGIDDIILSAPGVGREQGATYLVFGTIDGPVGADFNLSTINGRDGIKIFRPFTYDLAGISVASAGDFNCNGIAPQTARSAATRQRGSTVCGPARRSPTQCAAQSGTAKARRPAPPWSSCRT
jgi:hypothetical protein